MENLDGWQKSIANLMDMINPQIIYNGGFEVTQTLLVYLAPILLLIAVSARAVNVSSEVMEGNGSGKWGIFMKQLAIWGTVLVMYWSILFAFINFFNILNSWTAEQGSVGNVLVAASSSIDSIAAVIDDEESDFLDAVVNFINNIPKLVAFFIYFISFVWVMSVIAIAGLGKGLGFAICCIWGVWAIPSHIAGEKFSLMKGWLIFFVTILMWPIVENLLMFLFNGIFLKGANLFSDPSSSQENLFLAGAYLTLAVLNIIISAVVIAAPFITNALIRNAGTIGGLVTPLFGAAAASTAAIAKAMRGPKDMTSKGMQGSATTGAVSAGLNALNQSPSHLKSGLEKLGGMMQKKSPTPSSPSPLMTGSQSKSSNLNTSSKGSSQATTKGTQSKGENIPSVMKGSQSSASENQQESNPVMTGSQMNPEKSNQSKAVGSNSSSNIKKQSSSLMPKSKSIATAMAGKSLAQEEEGESAKSNNKTQTSTVTPQNSKKAQATRGAIIQQMKKRKANNENKQ